MAVPQKPRPRKGLKITAGILLLLTAAVLGVGLWQKNNIEAVMQYTKYSQEELEQQLESNDKAVEDVLKEALETAQKVDAESNAQTGSATPKPEDDPSAGVAEDPSEKPTEEPEAGTDPSLPVQPSEPRPAESVKPSESKPTESQKPSESRQEEQKPAAQQPQTPSTYEKELNVIVDKVYALRSEYLQALEDLQSEAVSAYKAIPKAQRTKKELTSFAGTYISKATSLEKTCDGKMDVLVRELTALQKKYGQSMELVDTVKYTYANEKSLKKAWYMSELSKRGMI